MPRYSSQILVKLKPAEKRALADAAAELGVTQSALLRAGLVLVTGRPPHAAPSTDQSPAAVVATK